MNVEAKQPWSVSSFIGTEKVPPVVTDLSMFDRPNYIDGFVLDCPGAMAWAPEEWSRAILEGAAPKRGDRVLWTLMGLRLGPLQSDRHIAGWRIERREDRWIRVETSAWYMDNCAVVLVEDDQVTTSLSLRYTSPIAPLVWALVTGVHERAVPGMMRRAARLLTI